MNSLTTTPFCAVSLSAHCRLARTLSVLVFGGIAAGCGTPKTTPITTPPPVSSSPVAAEQSDAKRTPPTPTAAASSQQPTGANTAAPASDAVTSDFALAQSQIEATIAKQPKEHNLRMQAAEFYMKTGHYAEAIPHLKAAAQISPDKVLAWLALGDAAALAGKFPLAEQAYNAAAKQDKANPFVARGRGQMYLLQRKFPQAQQVLEQGLKAHPQDIEISTVLGNLYLILNKPRAAVNVLAPIISRTSNRPDLHYLLGDAYERDLHIEAAILQMQEVVRLDPSNAQAWGRIGLYQNNLTRYKEARTPLLRAIALEPKEAYYHWAMGDSYLLENVSEENFLQAQREYETALQLDPKNQKALYSYGMGLTRRAKKEDLEKAIPLFQRLIALHPADMNAHFKLYETYRRLGRTQEAEAHRAKFKDLFAKGRSQTRTLYASSSFVDTAESHLKLGRKAMQAQNFTLAATEFQLALERDRNLDAARQGLLAAQKKQGLGAKTGTKR